VLFRSPMLPIPLSPFDMRIPEFYFCFIAKM